MPMGVPHPASLRAVALRLYQEGLTSNEIVEELGGSIDASTVGSWARRAGIARPRGRVRRSLPRSGSREMVIDKKLASEPRCSRCTLHLPKDPSDHVCLSLPIWQSPESGGLLAEGCSRKGQGHR